MDFFHTWAQNIREESLLSDFDHPLQRHPMHEWHWRVAENYLQKHPERVGGKIFDEEPIESKTAMVQGLWDDWYQGKQFHQEPLYPYTLAMLYALTGDDPETSAGLPLPEIPNGIKAMYILQMLLGVASVGLIYLLSRRYFGEVVALLAGLLTTGYAPLLYFEFILLRASWICFAGLLLVLLADRLRERQSLPRWFGFGLTTGIIVMLKTTMAVFSAGAALIILWPERKKIGGMLPKLGLMAAGCLIALSPVMVRNLSVGTPLFSMTSVGAVTFAASNDGQCVASEGWNPYPPTVAEIMGEAGSSLTAALPATIATHDSVVDYGGLLLMKFLQIWHWYEIPNNAKFYLFQLYSKVLQWLPAPFWLTAPFALYGLGLVLFCRRELRRRTYLLMLLIGTAILPMVAFYVLSRFRVPMALAMIPFAAYGIVELLKEKRRSHLLWTALGIGLCMLMINRQISERPGRQPRETVNYFDIRNHMGSYWGPMIQKAEINDDYALAAEYLQEFLDAMPPSIRGFSLQNPPMERFQVRMTGEYGTAYMRLAQTLEKASLEVRASRARRRGDELNAIAKEGFDRLVKLDPRLQQEMDRQDQLEADMAAQRQGGIMIQIVFAKNPERADSFATFAFVDGKAVVQPLLLRDEPGAPAKNSLPITDGKSQIAVISAKVESIILFKNQEQIAQVPLPEGLDRGKVNIINF
ncbi:MAG: glycosyltransferase family 39 protein [Planctomycetota bacterium]